MNKVMRNFLALLLGLVIGGLVNMALVVAGSLVVPPPAGVDTTSTESLAASMHLLGPMHFLFPFLAHALGTFAGAYTAFCIAASHRKALALLIGTMFLFGGITAAFVIPAPNWFVALDLILAYLPMAWLASRLGRPGAAQATT